MKFLISTLAIAILSFVLQQFFPWWTLTIAAFVVGVAFTTNGFSSFASGLIGTGSIWWIYAFMIDTRTQSILSEKIAQLFKVGSPMMLILISGLLAGIVGGFAALSGFMLKKSFE